MAPFDLQDLDDYIAERLNSFECDGEDIRMDPILDIVSVARRRLENGDYSPRVIEEAAMQLDEHIQVELGFRG